VCPNPDYGDHEIRADAEEEFKAAQARILAIRIDTVRQAWYNVFPSGTESYDAITSMFKEF